MTLETRIELPVTVEYRHVTGTLGREPEIEIISVIHGNVEVHLDNEQYDRLERECLEDAEQSA